MGQTDTIVTRLNDVTPDANCRLRIGMAFVTSGPARASLDVVKRYKAGGCAVWMVVGSDAAGGIGMTQSVYNDAARPPGSPSAARTRSTTSSSSCTASTAPRYQYRVYTGSQNWSQDALNENEEIFVKMAPGDRHGAPALRRLLHPLQRRLQHRRDLHEDQLPLPLSRSGRPGHRAAGP